MQRNSVVIGMTARGSDELSEYAVAPAAHSHFHDRAVLGSYPRPASDLGGNVFDELCRERPDDESPIDRRLITGYSEAELGKIETLYDLSITGDLRKFLLMMGRCDAGLIGDDPLILYRGSWTAQDQLEFQHAFRRRLVQAELEVYCEEKPFVISNESEVHYYFVLTASTEPDLVYHYYQGDESAHSTGLPLLDYLRGVLRRYTGYGKRPVRRGELLPRP
jgi:hypothetical protein